MELTTPIPQSSAGDRRRGFSFLRSSTMARCLSIAALGTSSAVVYASTPPQIPLFAEVPSTAPPAIAQALPATQALKRWVQRQRTMTLNPTALDVMNRPRTEAHTDVTLNLFDNGPRTLDLDM